MVLRSTLLSASALLTLIVSNVSAATYYPYTVERWPALLIQTSPSYPQYPSYPSSYGPSYSTSPGYNCLYRNAQGECMIEQYVQPSAPVYTPRELEEECDRSNRFEDDDDFYDCSYFDEDDDDYEAIDDDDFYDEDEDDFFFEDEDDFYDDDDDSSNDDDD